MTKILLTIKLKSPDTNKSPDPDRPILDIQTACGLHTKWKTSYIIEKIQRHFTEYIVGMKELPYVEKLKILKLSSLEYRRIIQVFKIAKEEYDKKPLTTFSLNLKT